MNYIDRIKRVFFTESDLGIKSLDPDFKEKYATERVIQDGAQSALLMANPIFQTVVSDVYLSLEAQLDMVDDLDHNADEQVRYIRLQRRAIRQIAAILDNKIAAMEQIQAAEANKLRED
jgi:hypothetical protein